MRGCAGWESPETLLGILLQKQSFRCGEMCTSSLLLPTGPSRNPGDPLAAVNPEFCRGIWSPSQVSESQKDLLCPGS